MLSEAPFGTTASGSFPSCPLPLPEHLQGSGLARCLVAATPLIQAAREQVRQGAQDLVKSYPKAPFDAASIEESLAANLAEPLLLMMTRVLVLELNVARLEGVLAGNTAEERFASYVSRLCDPVVAGQLLAEYPVLTEQIASRLERWAMFSLEFLRHACNDWDRLRPWFGNASPGAIVKVRGGAGDTHRGGRSVMIAGLAGGERLVYKPRSLAADGHFQQLLGWLNEHGAQPNFRLLKVLDRGDHGWSEFVPAAPCSTDAELSRFYQRQGGYLALLHALNACDFHCENLIAAGEHPVLIDLEALFHPSLEHTTTLQASEIARAFLGSSVMSVGLLPLRRWSSEEHSGIDLGGLSNSAGQLSPHPVPRWERMDSDEMHMVRKRVELTGSDNCPTLNGQQVNALDYADLIASGFIFTYRLLLTHRTELHSMLHHFADDEVRVIVRPTKTYAALYQESFHPDVLRNSADRSALFDRLQETVTWRPALERLIPSEHGDLLRGDIPLFTTRPASRHLRTSTMEHIDNYFDESGMSLVERRLSEFSETDLERQLWVVRASMTTLATHNDGPNVQAPHPGSCAQTVLAPEKLISAATTIGDHLATLALGNDEEVTWTGLVIAGLNQWSVSPLGTDLYDGLPGVILFLAYLTAVSGNPRYGSMAKAALKTLRRQTKDLQDAKAIGVFTGWSGIAYLLAHLGVIWADSSLFLEAENMVNSISSLVERDQVLDIIGGAAGCILALLALHRCQPSVRTLGVARACGEHLLRTAQRTAPGIAWLCGSLTTPLTGFAHGNAGIACALLALTEATGEKRYQQAGTEALAYERSLYSPEHRNWPDLRNIAAGRFVSAWCHGAPGIGLSRISALRYWKDSFIEQEIEAALSTTWAEGLGNNHALCHGDLGNGDILLHASEVLHERRWRACADQIAASALARATATGWVCANPLGVESPGFMTGLAGIGYALLRLANPKRVPSMLALEPPVLS